MNHADLGLLDAVDANGNGLRIEFVRQGSRWMHRLLLVVEHSGLPLLASVEGDEHQSFPPSPALQQLAFQQLNGANVALLVGMAGKNHWSVGVEAFPADRRIRFDVACRNQPCSGGQLGSAYKALVPWTMAESGSPVADVDALRCEWIPQPVGRWDARIIGPPEDPMRLELVIDRDSSTQRWCYEFRQSPILRP